MDPNYALGRLAARVKPDEARIQSVHLCVQTLASHLTDAFPRSKVIPIGSYSRGTAIAVHSNVDMLAVLPPKWGTWGDRRVPPQTLIDRVAKELSKRYGREGIQRAGHVIALPIPGAIQTLNVLPGFSVSSSARSPSYAVPGADLQWTNVRPQYHDEIFSRANALSGGKLRGISRLTKTWGVFASDPAGISSLYIDMVLATTGIATGIRTYGDCLSKLFEALAGNASVGLPDPAGCSGTIFPCASVQARRHLLEMLKVAAEQAQSAVVAQARGEYVFSQGLWRSLFKRSL